jgi:hypothetical protein
LIQQAKEMVDKSENRGGPLGKLLSETERKAVQGAFDEEFLHMIGNPAPREIMSKISFFQEVAEKCCEKIKKDE